MHRKTIYVVSLLILALHSRADVRLLAMGDWGSNSPRQKAMAQTLGDFAEKHPADAVMLAGDNFYIRVKDVNDPILQTVFDKMYAAKSLDVPFLAVPGNHDYQFGKLPIELEYSRRGGTRFTMPNPYYRMDLPKENPLVTVLMLDSNKPLMGPEKWSTELKWMRDQLEEVRGKRWIICCAHHPMFSNGNHGDNGELQRDWLPLFNEFHVDLYVCGHDHDLQHLESPKLSTSQLMVGGGGATTRPMRMDSRGPFSKSTNGFGDIELSSSLMAVKIFDTQTKLLHSFTRTCDREMNVMTRGTSDKATTRTVKSVTRDDATKE